MHRSGRHGEDPALAKGDDAGKGGRIDPDPQNPIPLPPLLSFLLGLLLACLFLIPLAFTAAARARAAALARAEAERRKGEAEARYARAAQQQELLGRLAGGLAHEIKNPLSTFHLNLELLREDLRRAGAADDRAIRRVDLLVKEARRLEEVLADFLRFARGQKPDLRPSDLNRTVGEILDFIGPEAERRSVIVRRALAPDLPPAPFDPALVKQAVLNVFLNALQAMEGGGELLARTSQDGPFLAVEVTDTGPGLSPEEIEKIFAVYYTTKRGGTGLGLPTTKRILEDHGGAISVVSEKGRGTSFTLRIPLRPDPSGAAP